jgi:hypothetical protein
MSECGSTHLLVHDKSHNTQDKLIEITAQEHDQIDFTWLVACCNSNEYVDESAFIVRKHQTQLNPEGHSHRQVNLRIPSLKSDPENSVPQSRSDRARVAYRRSDVSSIPLKPDGVFKGICLSIYGWSDHRLESALIHQITSNGGTVVSINSPGHFACICADGSNPLSNNNGVVLVSQRWLNECLASGQVLDPKRRAIFAPSTAQLPLLLTRRVCVYISEKDQGKFDEIAEVAKLCGIKYVSRSDTRIPLSAVTHFIFFDMASANRRRDLLPVATKSNKFVVSFEWLIETFRYGSLQTESAYDMSTTMNHPALADDSSGHASVELSPLSNIAIVGGPTHEHLGGVVGQLGARFVRSSQDTPDHECQGRLYLTERPGNCTCTVITEHWLLECSRQKRIISIENVPINQGRSAQDNTETATIGIQWENSRMSLLKSDLSSS